MGTTLSIVSAALIFAPPILLAFTAAAMAQVKLPHAAPEPEADSAPSAVNL